MNDSSEPQERPRSWENDRSASIGGRSDQAANVSSRGRSGMRSTQISPATWVQWLYDWDATAGDHKIEVRATDGTGVVQTADQSPPAPDGARGHHTIGVHVG